MHLAQCRHFSSENHDISKDKWGILEISILLFDFSYFDVELFQHDSTYINSTALFLIIDFLITNIS